MISSVKYCKSVRIWSHLLKKSLMENFIFCAVKISEISCTLILQKMNSFNYLHNAQGCIQNPIKHLVS